MFAILDVKLKLQLDLFKYAQNTTLESDSVVKENGVKNVNKRVKQKRVIEILMFINIK